VNDLGEEWGKMPTVLRLGRYRFYFFSNEGKEPPHIHVKASDCEAKFWLNPMSLAANYGFKAHELTTMERILKHYQEDLLEAWNEYFPSEDA
jgi:hypothetical protein